MKSSFLKIMIPDPTGEACCVVRIQAKEKKKKKNTFPVCACG